MSDTWLTHHSWCSRQSWPRNGLSFWAAGRQRRTPCRVCLHSTETTSWPGYRAGADAPHFTIDLRTGHVRQHMPLNWGARALMVGPWGTNNVDGTVQIEIIGAVTPGYPQRYGHYDLVNTFPTDDRAHRYLARLLRAISAACPDIPIHVSDLARWVPYPASYGTGASQRLTPAQWNSSRGWVGHQHAPGNSHGDPGALVGLAGPVLSYARGTGGSDPTPADPTPTYAKGYILDVQRDLNALAIADRNGNALDEDDVLGDRTEQAIRAYQQLTNLDVDGIPGPNTDKSLEDDMALLTDLTKTVDAMHARVKKQGGQLDRIERRDHVSAEDVATAVWSRELYGFVAHYWLRDGAIGDPEHPNFPADPGTRADAFYAGIAAAGKPVTPHLDVEITPEIRAKIDARYPVNEEAGA